MKKVILILITSVICLTLGLAVAYYNTSSLGYDDTDMISYSDGVLTVMDNSVNIEKIRQDLESVLNKYLRNPITI